VVAEDTLKPLGKARLTLFTRGRGGGTGIDGEADAEGGFRLNPYHASTYELAAFAPRGLPYLNLKQEIDWPNGEQKYVARVELPRGTLIHGNVASRDNRKPIAGASVQYWPRRDNPHDRDDIVTGWQATVVTKNAGDFSIAVLPGPGHLLIHAPGRDFVLQEIGSGQLYRGQSGGQRHYAHAFVPIDPHEDDDGQNLDPLEILLDPGAVVQGRLINPAGTMPKEALVVWRGQANASITTVRGDTDTVYDGKFRLTGIAREGTTPIFFLDTASETGAVFDASAAIGQGEQHVHLEPCGAAVVRFIDSDGQPFAGYETTLRLVVTPGPSPMTARGSGAGELLADEIIVANFDRPHYWEHPRSDADGRLRFPALIPGATYRILASRNRQTVIAREFTVKASELRDLGDIVVDQED
jgi:hypothetical protein